MAYNGFVKIYRQLLDWEWYSDHNACRVFVHILLKANYKESRYRGCVIPAGSLVAGRIELAQQVGLTEQQTRTALNKLKSTNEITIKSTNNFSIISITNWKTFQGDNHQTNQRITNDQPTDNQRITTSKEDNNIIKEEVKKDPLTPKGGSGDKEREILFDEFWSLYTPIRCNGKLVDKGSKQTAKKSFMKILSEGKTTYDEIRSGLQAYLNHCRDNNQLTCGAAVFLNQERWENDYSVSVEGNGNNNAKGQRQEPRSQLAIYAEIANELKNKDNLHGEWSGF